MNVTVGQIKKFKNFHHISSGLKSCNLPVGSERVNKGYILVKVAEPNVWLEKQRQIYESMYGNIPNGHKVIFADNNNRNFDINNLILVTDAEALIMNNRKLRYDNAVKDKDCEKIYELIDLEEGKYLTKEKFINQCKININDYKDYTVEIEHKIKNNLVKIYNNASIYFPADSEIYIDDKLVEEKIYNDENNIYKIYKIEKLFEAEYNIKFKNKNDEENTKIIISNDDSKTKLEYNNSKQTVVVIGSNTCGYCRRLLNFLDTLDKNIFEIKYLKLSKFSAAFLTCASEISLWYS